MPRRAKVGLRQVAQGRGIIGWPALATDRATPRRGRRAPCALRAGVNGRPLFDWPPHPLPDTGGSRFNAYNHVTRPSDSSAASEQRVFACDRVSTFEQLSEIGASTSVAPATARLWSWDDGRLGPGHCDQSDSSEGPA